MTVIAAAKDELAAYIASDSHGSSGGVHLETGSKIIKKNNYYIGFTCSYRVADIINEATTFPSRIKNIKDLRKFRDELKKLLLEDGCEETAKEEETISHPIGLVIVAEGNLYSMDSDYQIHEHKEYIAVGSGREFALGAMRSMLRFTGDPEDSVQAAVEAAIFHCSGCGGNIHYEESTKPKRKSKLEK